MTNDVKLLTVQVHLDVLDFPRVGKGSTTDQPLTIYAVCYRDCHTRSVNFCELLLGGQKRKMTVWKLSSFWSCAILPDNLHMRGQRETWQLRRIFDVDVEIKHRGSHLLDSISILARITMNDECCGCSVWLIGLVTLWANLLLPFCGTTSRRGDLRFASPSFEKSALEGFLQSWSCLDSLPYASLGLILRVLNRDSTTVLPLTVESEIERYREHQVTTVGGSLSGLSTSQQAALFLFNSSYMAAVADPALSSSSLFISVSMFVEICNSSIWAV